MWWQQSREGAVAGSTAQRGGRVGCGSWVLQSGSEAAGQPLEGAREPLDLGDDRPARGPAARPSPTAPNQPWPLKRGCGARSECAGSTRTATALQTAAAACRPPAGAIWLTCRRLVRREHMRPRHVRPMAIRSPQLSMSPPSSPAAAHAGRSGPWVTRAGLCRPGARHRDPAASRARTAAPKAAAVTAERPARGAGAKPYCPGSPLAAPKTPAPHPSPPQGRESGAAGSPLLARPTLKQLRIPHRLSDSASPDDMPRCVLTDQAALGW